MSSIAAAPVAADRFPVRYAALDGLKLALADGIVYLLRGQSVRRQVAGFALTYFIGVAIQCAGNYHVFHGLVDAVLNKNYTYRNFLFFGMPLVGMGALVHRGDLVTRVST